MQRHTDTHTLFWACHRCLDTGRFCGWNSDLHDSEGGYIEPCFLGENALEMFCLHRYSSCDTMLVPLTCRCSTWPGSRMQLFCVGLF